MEIRIENINRLTPDTTDIQLQAGRDPIEKCGQLIVRCEIEYKGLRRKASMSRQFRIVSMVPGPWARYSLFVKKTPYPDSYNGLGIKFDGSVDTSYNHPPLSGKKLFAPLTIFNGTDSVTVTNSIPERSLVDDKNHLRNRGWIYLGPAGASSDQAVFIKIPSGFNPVSGGHFMMGWPSLSAMPVLSPEVVNDNTHFAQPAEIADHDFTLGGKYQGYYTWEAGNPYGAGGRNMWPGLSEDTVFEESDHIFSASTWIYPFGNLNRESRTLIFGPVLAGFLKFYFIRGKNITTNAEWKGSWGGMSESMFNSKTTAGLPIQSFADLWSGTVNPEILSLDMFKTGYESFKKLMPYNSLPLPSTSIMPSNGIAMNLIFDFMKYQRSTYPQLDAAPGISAVGFDAEKFLVPNAQEMRTSPIKGIHPYEETGIYLEENGQYDPNAYPDNCYFHGDLSAITIYDSNLISNRITNQLDLSDCSNTSEEQEALEKFLFRKVSGGGSYTLETDRAGIFLIKRRSGVGESYTDALNISSRALKIVKPQIVIIDTGSLIIENDITANLSDGAPDKLFSIALIDGDFYIDGSGFTRVIHACLASLNSAKGRLLRPTTVGASAPENFKIYGSLALTEIGLYEDPMSDPRNHLGTTMSHFSQGGEIHYNPRFNPSSPAYSNSYAFVMEESSGKFTIDGAM
jgi:hypothetical protein